MQVIANNVFAENKKGQNFDKDQNSFIENKGQWDKEVLFLCKMNNQDAWITKSGLVLDYYKLEQKRDSQENAQMMRKSHIVKTTILHQEKYSESKGNNSKEGYLNFLIGENRNNWATEVKMYSDVLISNIYKNIDLKYYFENKSLRYDYIINPRGNVKDITWKFEGTDKNYINREGELIFETIFGDVKHTKLFTYQLINGVKKEIKSRFIYNESKNEFQFSVDKYDSTKPLVIDPIIYSTIIAGTLQDAGFGIVADNSGNTYLTGTTNSSNFPVTVGAPQPTLITTGGMGFIAKLNSLGTGLVYCTYVGGNYTTYLNKIDVDPLTGVAYAVGQTAGPGMPIIGNNSVYSNAPNDVLLVVLNSTGTNYVYSRYITGYNVNGNGDDQALDVRVDMNNSNFVYITGFTKSPTFPTTIANATFTGYRPFVCKADITQSNVLTGNFGFQYSRILVSQTESKAFGIDIDTYGNAYITGATYDNLATAPNLFPGTVFSPALTNNSFRRAFITKLDNTGAISYSTFGGSNSDDAFIEDIAINPSGEAFVIGTALSFPTTLSFPSNGLNDIILLKVNALGANVQSRFLGGSGDDKGKAIHCFNNFVYITGSTNSLNYPWYPCQPISNAATDLIYTRMSDDLNTILYSTLISGPNGTLGFDMDVDASGTYLVGYTNNGSTFPTVPPGNIFGSPGSLDILVVKYQEQFPVQVILNSNSPCVGQNINLIASTGYANYHWSGPNGYSSTTTANTTSVVGSLAASGIYSVTATDANGCIGTSTINVVVNPLPPIPTLSINQPCIPLSGSVSLTVNSPTVAGYSYQLNGGAAQTSIIFNTVSTAGTYTVTVSSAGNCSATSIINIPGCSTFCPALQGATQNVIAVPNGSLSSNIFPSGNVPQVPIIIDGTFTINLNLNIFNNQNVYFTASSQAVLQNQGVVLDIRDSRLQSCGLAMWYGIRADGVTSPNSNITLLRNYIQDMSDGIQIANLSSINCQNNSFVDNRYSIKLKTTQYQPNAMTIINNTFKRVIGLLPPYASLGKPYTGIDMDNIFINGTPATGVAISNNYFENMWNGINIQQSTPKIRVLSFNNNRFKDITSNSTAWGANTISSIAGWALYARCFGGTTLGSKLYIYVDHMGAPLTNFDNCDKGICFRNIRGMVHNNKFDKTKLGMHLGETNGNAVDIANNTILNTEIGISHSLDGVDQIQQNTISLLSPSVLSPSVFPTPTAIYGMFSNPNTATGGIYAGDNIINIPNSDIGIGISMNNAPPSLMERNKIHFTATTGTVALGIPNLVGMYANNTLQFQALINIIDNNFSVNSNTTYIPGNNAAVYFNLSRDCLLRCNTLNYMKYGVFATGTNGSVSDYRRIAGNTFRGQDADLFCWQLGTAGTLGLIGLFTPTSKMDANNTYLGSPANAANKVYRFNPNPSTCLGSITEIIATTPAKLIQNNSTALINNFTCRYPVVNPATFTSTFDCGNIDIQYWKTGTAADNEMDIDLAQHIADENIDYESDFEDGATERFENDLYRWLVTHPAERNSDINFLDFYNNKQSDYGPMAAIEARFRLLSDSLTIEDTLTWQNNYDSLLYLNTILVPHNLFETNAKWVNALYLRYILQGLENLTATELTNLETIAITCPYLSGTAVYRARAIVSSYMPGIHYDDLVICNSQGVYKNGNTKLQEQINALANAHHEKVLDASHVMVYPNPTSNLVTIEYSDDTDELITFSLYEITGKVILEQTLPSHSKRYTIDLHEYAQGVYSYKITTRANAVFNGKLIKE